MNGKILSLDLFMVILIVMTTLSVIRLSNQSSAQVQTYMQYVLGTIPAFADSHNVSTGTKPIFSWPSGQYVGPLPSLPQPGSTRAIGSIASIQNDNSGKPEWLATGNWRLAETISQNGIQIFFKASFFKVMLDGTAKHMHSISDSKLTLTSTVCQLSHSIPPPCTLNFDGTANFTLEDGLKTSILVKIEIINRNIISISPEISSVSSYFGDTPIYGMVLRDNLY